MVVPSSLREQYRRTDRWLRDHVVVWWLVLALIPGGAYAVADVVLSDGAVHSALVLGAVFGATFATITVVLQRWRE